VHFPRRITIADLIEERPFGNVVITDGSATGFRQSITVENRPDCVQTADIVTAGIQPAVICPRQTDDYVVKDENVNVDQPEATAVRRRRPILSALGRRIVEVGRMLCC